MRPVLLPLLLALTFCGAAQAGPRVVADIPPVAALVSAVLGGPASSEPVPALLGPGDDPHHFQLRPSQARALAGADVVFWIGPTLTPWLAGLLSGSAAQVALDKAEGVTARPPMFAGEAHAGEGGSDPHIWLDPANARAMLAAIAAELARLDPSNAARYAANAARAQAELDEAASAARAILAPWRGAALVVAHDAYAHWAAAFGLTVVAAIADGAASEPGAASLSALHRQLTALDGPGCILGEPQHPARWAETLARESGLGLGRLDPLAAGRPGDWFLRMAEAVRDCMAGQEGAHP